MEKKLLILFLSLSTFFSCANVQKDLISQQNNFLHEKSSILKNYSESLTQFNEIAYLIDSDLESQWAYRQVDSLLSAINASGKNYYEDLTKVYATYSHIFYGLSYTNSVHSVVRGDDYSLEELVETIIQPLNGDAINYSNMANHELASMYSMINFYKVGRMYRYNSIQSIFDEYSGNSKEIYKQYPAEEAYRIASFDNKKLHYKIMFCFIVDVYYINHPDKIDAENDEYIDNLVRLGEIMDELPIEHEPILALSDAEYYGSILKASEVYKEMFALLIEQFNIMTGS